MKYFILFVFHIASQTRIHTKPNQSRHHEKPASGEELEIDNGKNINFWASSIFSNKFR